MTPRSDRADTTPWAGDTDMVSPPWGFPSEHARRVWVSGDRRREGVMAAQAWRAAVRWVLQHESAEAWVAEATTTNHEIRRQP